MNKLKTSLGIALFLVIAQSSFAQTKSAIALTEGGHVGGGDPTTARKIALAKKFATLKSDLRSWLKNMDLNSIEDSSVKKMMADLIARGLDQDIQDSPFVLSSECENEKQSIQKNNSSFKHAAFTQIGEKKASVCFDLDLLAEQNTTSGELLGLTVHEHAHHFGYEDNDDTYQIITVLADLYARQNIAKVLIENNSGALNKNFRSHMTTWSTLFTLKQIDKSFMTAGSASVSSFPILSEDTKEIIAFAVHMDSVFVDVRGAKRNKKGISYPLLIASLLKEGASNGENLRWFADQMHALYTFFGE